MNFKMALTSFSFLLLPLTGFADYSVHTFQANQCQAAGHTNEYVLRICPVQMANGDRVILQGNNLRSNLVVTQGNSHNNNPYYMALGIDSANYSVGGDINVVLKDGQRHALIYRLNYTRYDGQTGYQIITVRLGRGRHANQTTCTRFAFDSNTATMFTHLPEPQREQTMRRQALSQVQASNFQDRNQRCMEYEHHEERPAPSQLPLDPNEGDNLESSP